MIPSDWIRVFVERLERLGIPYAVSGSVAGIVYGEPRLTADIDVLVAASTADATRLPEVFDETEFYLPDIEVIRNEIRSDRGHVNAIHHDSGAKADFYFLGKDSLNSASIRRRCRERIGDLELWLVPPEHLIVKKLEWYRDGGSSRQLRDVRGILAGPKVIDQDEVKRLVDERGLHAQWQEALD